MTTTVNINFPFEETEAAVEGYEIIGDLLYLFFGTGIYTYTNLLGTDNNFIAIWADASSSMNNGKVYISTLNSLLIIDTAKKIVVDYYTQTDKGRSGDTLSADDIVDINKVNRGS